MWLRTRYIEETLNVPRGYPHVFKLGVSTGMYAAERINASVRHAAAASESERRRPSRRQAREVLI
jgi:hypothetical protein